MICVHRVFRDVFGDPKEGEDSSDEMDQACLVSDRLRNSGTLTDEQLAPLCVTMDDFLQAISKVQPSAKREGFSTIPDVSWSDVGALEDLREELDMAIVMPIEHPEMFASVGISAPCGVLLYGPPGCGKTLVAKAVSAESGASFISIKGPELLNKFVGESERAVREVFQRARSSPPCVIFFDELDALAPRRGGQGSNQVSERVVNQLLTEMDGLNERGQIFVIAATNRPDIIDQAMLRPGRLDKLLYVPLPSAEDRVKIFLTHTRKSPLSDDVDINRLALDERCNGFSGADIAAFVREACTAAIRERCDKVKTGAQASTQITVSHKNFLQAFNVVKPSVSERAQRRYDRMQMLIRRTRGGGIASETKQGDVE